jgi:hypothetical protein
MAKVTRPDPTVSWRATVNSTLPTADMARATPTAVRVERTAAGRRPGVDRNAFTHSRYPDADPMVNRTGCH